MNHDDDLLANVDRRAGAAAMDVRDRAAARRAPVFDPDRPVGLAPLVPSGVDERPRRLGIAVAVAATLVVGGGLGWMATKNGDEGRTTPAGVTTGPPRPFVATDLPEGFELAGVADLGASRTGSDGAGPMLVYGPSPTEPRLGVVVQPQVALDQAFAVQDAGYGRHALLRRDRDRDQSLLLVSPTLDTAALARVADSTVVDGDRPAVDPATLPDGWHLLAEEPDAIALVSPVSVLRWAGGGDRSVAKYLSGPEDPEDPTSARAVVVWSTTGDETSVHAQELFTERSEAVTVRGHDALLGTYGPVPGPFPGASRYRSWVLSWVEATGEVIRVQATGADRAEVLAVAEGVMPVGPAEWADKVARTQLGVFAPHDELPGFEDIAGGRFPDGTPWRLQVSTTQVALPVTRLTVDTDGGRANGQSPRGQASASSSSDSGSRRGFRSAETLDEAGRHFASGLLGPDVRTVELRRPDGTAIVKAEVVGDGDRRAWVAELVEDPTVALALDGTGTELGRLTFEDLEGNVTVDLEDETTTSLGG